MRRNAEGDRGIALIWTAAALVFLLGAAALAVDASGFFDQARVQQTGADLACLAGVRHAPTNRDLAVSKVAGYLGPNVPQLQGMPTTPNSTLGNISTFSYKNFQIEVETPYDDGDPATRNDALMRVTVQQVTPTQFGRVLGTPQVTIVQEAYCQVGSPISFGDLPLALGAGAANQCATDGTSCTVKYSGSNCTFLDGPGACGSIDVPRHDDPPGTGGIAPPQGYIYNIALGANWRLAAPGEPGHENDCGAGLEPCGFVRDVSGNKPPQLTKGLITGLNGYPGRLVGDPPHNGLPYPDSLAPSVFWDGHMLADEASCDNSQVRGSNCGGDTTAPAAVYKIFDCTEPRFTSVPVVANFDPGLLHEYLGSRFAWIQEPDMAPDDPGQLSDPVHSGESEFEASDKVQIVSIRILTFPLGEDTPVENASECGFHELVEGAPSVVRLIQP